MFELIKLIILACQIQHVDSKAHAVDSFQKGCQVKITKCLIKKNNFLTDHVRGKSLIKCMAERK